MKASEFNRALVYAGAAPHDIGSTALPLIEHGRLLRAWIGTVYGMPIATTRGAIFKSSSEATHNGLRFVSECKRIVAEGRPD